MYFSTDCTLRGNAYLKRSTQEQRKSILSILNVDTYKLNFYRLSLG